MFSCLQFTVGVKDDGLVSRSDEAIVTIRVTREGLPFFSNAEYTVTIREDLPTDSLVFDVDATDPRASVSRSTVHFI